MTIVGLKHPQTGEIKSVKVGFAWVPFLFAWFFGLPLFLRQLHVWGVVMCGLFIGGFAFAISSPELYIAASLASLVLHFVFGFAGNAMTAKNYLKNGWEFVEPDSDTVKFAKQKWGIA